MKPSARTRAESASTSVMSMSVCRACVRRACVRDSAGLPALGVADGSTVNCTFPDMT